MRRRGIVTALVAVLGGLLLLGLLGGGLMAWPGMMHYGFAYGSGYRLLPWVGLGAMLFRTLIVAAGLLLFVELLHQRRLARIAAGAGATRPMEIVRERYARGEIDREQFDQMRRDLESR